ncbi:hypothetical protein [Vannielia litorea]|uniref:Uncharacterized protein n=1 Tax=Vannielia litorea TaxID=1217970 RepID=A0A1N6FZG1_9RHOB|nr:hypothetical protein [Vannielia litorea]SIO00591.1 hypothetical protein SAMN05444002_2080 [Vannielia litorea]
MTNTPEQSRDSTQTAKDTVKDLRDETLSTVQDLKEKAMAEAGQRAEAGKATVADEISGVGNALRRAADELHKGSPQERTFGRMATALADLSDKVRDKDLGEVAGDLSTFARNNPLAFLGGAALLGFAGTRLARASQRDAAPAGPAVDLGDPWHDDEDDEALDAAIRQQPSPYRAPATGETS